MVWMWERLITSRLKNKNHVPVCPVEKEVLILDALKHFRMLDEDVEYRKESAV